MWFIEASGGHLAYDEGWGQSVCGETHQHHLLASVRPCSEGSVYHKDNGKSRASLVAQKVKNLPAM